MKALVLAGGFGTRLRECVSDVPKPLAPIHNRPFLDYLLDYWIEQGVTSFFLLTGYLGHLIDQHYQGVYKGAAVHCIQEPKAFGTGGAIKHALKQASDFEEGFILNGDTFFEVDARKLMEFHQLKKSELTLALRQVQQNDRYSGLSLSEEGRVMDFLKREEGSQDLLINGGVYFFGSKAIQLIKSVEKETFSIEDDFFPDCLSKGLFYGCTQKGRFIDIGIPSDYKKAPSFFTSYASH